MKIVLGTLCLNEMQWLPALYEQHKDWPGLVKWVFVEAADVVYAAAAPGRVSSQGLSVDGTTEFLEDLAKRDPRIVHIRHGFCGVTGSSQGKCEARQRYLSVADEMQPNLIVVVDADEFYTADAQHRITTLARRGTHYRAFLFPQRHIWYPPSLLDCPSELLNCEVVGGYWNVPHCRVWKWEPNLRYHSNHNWPETSRGVSLIRYVLRGDGPNRIVRMARYPSGVPECVHMGFASLLINRMAKHAYYQARGEGRGDGRQMYVDCRTAYETWKPGDVLPHGARVIPYTGPIPEVFTLPETPNAYLSRPDQLLPPAEHAASHQSLEGPDPQAH